MPRLAIVWGDFWAAAGGIAACVTIGAVIGRLLGLDRAWRWLTRHIEEDRRAKFVDAVMERVQPQIDVISSELGQVKANTAQLCPNGGSSMYDRMQSAEQTLREQGQLLESVAAAHGIRRP